MDPENEIETPETTPEQDALAAMDAGIKQADEEAVAVETPPADAPEGEQSEGEPENGEPVEAPAAEAPAEGEPEQPDPSEQARAEAEAEADALGLKPGKSRERFHELTAQVREAAPVMDAIKAANISAEDLPTVLQQASSHREWVQHVVDTGATPEQYGMTLDYLSDIGAAGRGDMAAAERAFEKVMGEAKALATMLGRSIEGVHDPLEAHPDLRDLVDEMAIPREKAIELARDRDRAKAVEQGQAQMAEQGRAQQEQDEGTRQLIVVDSKLRAEVPGYDHIRPALNAAATRIRATVHPSQWGQAVWEEAQALIPLIPRQAQPAQPERPPVGRVPLRGAGTHGRMQQAQFDDPLAALDAGIAAVR